MSLAGSTHRCLVTTILERVRRSPLDITLNYRESPFEEVTLLFPFAQQIKRLLVEGASWAQVRELLEAIPGPVSLHTLRIWDDGEYDPLPLPDPLLSPLLSGAVNVKKLDFFVSNPLTLSCFTFPNLTTFEFWTWVGCEVFPISLLLNFLKASPSLQEIDITIAADLFLEDVPPDATLVLPDVTTFSLAITSDRLGYEISTRISCPSARTVKFEHGPENPGRDIPDDIFLPSRSWTKIFRHDTTGVVQKVVLKLAVDEDTDINCLLTFSSSKGASLETHYSHGYVSDIDDIGVDLDKRHSQAFSQACSKIRDHTLLENLRYLHIRGGNLLAGDLKLATSDVGKLLGSIGPLEEFTLESCDLRPYLDAFLDTPLFPDAFHPAAFPLVGWLAIIDPMQSFCNNGMYAAAIVKLAESQHARGAPFERMAFNTRVPFAVIQELLLFVDTVDETLLN